MLKYITGVILLLAIAACQTDTDNEPNTTTEVSSKVPENSENVMYSESPNRKYFALAYTRSERDSQNAQRYFYDIEIYEPSSDYLADLIPEEPDTVDTEAAGTSFELKYPVNVEISFDSSEVKLLRSCRIYPPKSDQIVTFFGEGMNESKGDLFWTEESDGLILNVVFFGGRLQLLPLGYQVALE